MNILISGGTGFVGKALVKKLLDKHHKLSIISRQAKELQNETNITYLSWDQLENEQLPIYDAVINLAGESINGRWTKKKKKAILQSRMDVTQRLLSYIESLEQKPSVFINASAIGFYGTDLYKEFTEAETNSGQDFLATVVYLWEKEAIRAEELGIRTVLARFGMVLGQKEGALPKMLLPYKLFAGGPIGTGKQWISWAHIDDVVNSIEYCLQNNLSGPVNITTPNPVKMDEFGQTLGKTMQRPHWLKTPSLPLKILLGEMSILILEGQKVIPTKLIDTGYEFTYPTLDKALKSCLGEK